MEIRPETPTDHDAITSILIEAFGDHPYSHQTEHLIVIELRRAGALTISLVAEMDGQVVGHIAFSPVTINGAQCLWYALGPVAVARRLWRRGIGRQLIEAGLEGLRGMGAHGCVLVGDPAFYTCFGFQPDPALTMEGVPPQYFMALAFDEQRARGRVEHHPAFAVKPQATKRPAAAG
jgi:putative acetyltransferase